ncbi:MULTISPECIES: hypothetical protein [Marinomonas]|uniref:Uncharacterized protein n=1 Tax=Marinomonas rhodophyticola TaxID=2992803 RepID=A0ABT3KFW1_9GAMM|nr:hypothetical protein [Marinomonas sp. KJ51-3]MCW4629442.1 hypothetical protein [Marinomonas sp. KJ51-3]
MTKYIIGETSSAVKNKKKSITISMAKKTELLDLINSHTDIFKTLDMKGDLISESSVHKWSDNDLGVISYSWNTAHAEHNKKQLNLLLNSIKKTNNRLSNDKNNKKKILTNRSTDKITKKLRQENEELKKALAEVYRAYMHLVENFSEDQIIDDAIRKLILDQVKILGKQRIWEII